MSKAEQILAAVEAVFDREGFQGTGVDRLIAAAGVSPRTLYREFGSKDELVRAVLMRREARYLERLERDVARHAGAHGDPLLACFDALRDWLTSESARGCLFLRALGEYGDRRPAIAAAATDHKHRVRRAMHARVAAAGLDPTGGLPERLMLLLEGATALAPVLGPELAVAEARAAAADLLATARAGRVR